MKLKELRDLLLSTGIPVYHYIAKDVTGNYIVWAEERQGDTEYADDKILYQGIEGRIFYYTQTEFDPAFDLIQEKLNSGDLSWKLEQISYDEETSYIIYEWIFEVTNCFS